MLDDDVVHERQVMDEIYEFLKHDQYPLRHWYYSHFHQSWHSSIDDVMYKMLALWNFAR